MEFSIDSLKGKIQIVAYLAKSVPDQFKSRSILDLEVFAILITQFTQEEGLLTLKNNQEMTYL